MSFKMLCVSVTSVLASNSALFFSLASCEQTNLPRSRQPGEFLLFQKDLREV